mgnify:CR=1 FL=1
MTKKIIAAVSLVFLAVVLTGGAFVGGVFVGRLAGRGPETQVVEDPAGAVTPGATMTTMPVPEESSPSEDVDLQTPAGSENDGVEEIGRAHV